MSDLADTKTDLTGTGAFLGTATAAKTGQTVTVNVNGTVTTVNTFRDVPVSSGDVVAVHRIGSEWFVIGRVWAAAPVPPVGGTGNEEAPVPKPGTVYGTSVFGPVETRSWQATRWRTDNTAVYQGQYGGNGNHTGSVFYGSGPRSLAGATVTYARIQVQRLSGGIYAAQATTMRLMTNSTRPGGAPTLTSSTGGPSLAVGNTHNNFQIPQSWAQAMVDGTAGGIAFFDGSGSPYVRFAGTGDWSPAFALTMIWQR